MTETTTVDDEAVSAGKAAKMLRMAPRSLCKLIDSGQLAGWRKPGGCRPRRVLRSVLLAFAKEHGIPVAE